MTITEENKPRVDISLEKEVYTKTINQLVEEYGDPSSVPSEDRRLAAERLRAAYVAVANPDAPLRQTFKTYSVDSKVWSFFLDDSDIAQQERRMSRAEKQQKVLNWAADNVGAEVTLEKLMEVGDIAYSMAKKIVENRPDLFWKIKRGLFSVRDPKADREAEKAAADKSEKN